MIVSNTSPLISICIPTFNGERYLEDSIKSALNQTYKNIEIVLSDDNSTDKTIIIAKKIKETTDIPFYIFSHTPQGIGSNWNHCISKAKGEYIKLLFQDDIIAPNCIEEMIKPFLENKKLGLSFCRRNFIDEYKNESTDWINTYQNLHTHWTKLKPIQNGRELLNDIRLLEQPRNKVGEPTAVLLNKAVFEQVGYFNTDLKQSLDYEFWYRVFTKFDVAFVDLELAIFRLHSNQATSVNSKTSISDYDIYPHLIYKNCFWYLNPKLRKELFFKYNLIGKSIKKVVKLCRRYIQL